MIIRQILTDFLNSFTAVKSVKIPTKQYTTLPTAPKMCYRTTARNLNRRSQRDAVGAPAPQGWEKKLGLIYQENL